MYKVIVAGSRDFSAPFNMELAGVLIPDAIEEFKVPLKEVEIVSGTARGADMMGEAWVEAHNYHNESKVSLSWFPANWKKYGNAAGPIRNQEMADYADALILFWNGESKGSQDMLRKALKRGMPTIVYRQSLSSDVEYVKNPDGSSCFLQNYTWNIEKHNCPET